MTLKPMTITPNSIEFYFLNIFYTIMDKVYIYTTVIIIISMFKEITYLWL